MVPAELIRSRTAHAPDNPNCDKQLCICGINACNWRHLAADDFAARENGGELLSSCYDASAAAYSKLFVLKACIAIFAAAPNR